MFSWRLAPSSISPTASAPTRPPSRHPRSCPPASGSGGPQWRLFLLPNAKAWRCRRSDRLHQIRLDWRCQFIRPPPGPIRIAGWGRAGSDERVVETLAGALEREQLTSSRVFHNVRQTVARGRMSASDRDSLARAAATRQPLEADLDAPSSRDASRRRGDAAPCCARCTSLPRSGGGLFDRPIVRAHPRTATTGSTSADPTRVWTPRSAPSPTTPAARCAMGLLPSPAIDRLGPRPAVLAWSSASGPIMADRAFRAGWHRRWL